VANSNPESNLSSTGFAGAGYTGVRWEGRRAMEEIGVRREPPQLKELVVEASRALARLDADRLEELALSCQALNRELTPLSQDRRLELARQSREVDGDMATFARVLDATRSNLNVMNRLRELRSGQLEYGPKDAPVADTREVGHGDN
jgi:hypothetical protein